MAGGHVDRTLLSSYYQNPGDVYDDTKTEGAYEVLAQQTDDNWDEHVNHRTAAELDHPDGSVTNRKIRNGTITADKFVPGALNNDSQNGLRITQHLADKSNPHEVISEQVNLAMQTNVDVPGLDYPMGVTIMNNVFTVTGFPFTGIVLNMRHPATGNYFGQILCSNSSSGPLRIMYRRWRFNEGWSDFVEFITSDAIKEGNGSPEGVIAAAAGTLYRRLDGGASTSLYVKESGTGNTGWKAVQTA